MDARVLDASQAGQGPRLAVHRSGGVEHRTAGGGALYFRFRRLPRLGPGALCSGGHGRLGGGPAQDVAGVGAAIERGFDRSAAAADAAAGLGGGHRLAPAALLRAAEEGRQVDRAALDQRSAGGLVSTYDEKREAAGERLDLCELSLAPEPQRSPAAATETVVRRLAGVRFAHRDPRALPPALRDRKQ